MDPIIPCVRVLLKIEKHRGRLVEGKIDFVGRNREFCIERGNN